MPHPNIIRAIIKLKKQTSKQREREKLALRKRKCFTEKEIIKNVK